MQKSRFLFIMIISIFLIFPFEVSAMQIFVKKIDSENIRLEVESSDTIEMVKEKIYQVDNAFLPEKQKLVFGGKEMENFRTLADYQVQQDSTVFLFLTLSTTINVKYNLENLNVTTDNVTSEGDLGNNSFVVLKSKDFTAKLEVISGYELPNIINVKIDENVVDNEKYTYNCGTGEIFISKDLLVGDIVIDAKAPKEEYKVIFDANGGTFNNNQNIIEIEDIINFNYNEFEKPIKDGYRFVGFYTEKIGGISFEEVMNSEAGIEEETTFYARWEENSSSGLGSADLEEENPKTFDGIGTSILIGTFSLIGLVGTTIYLKKKIRA